MESKQNNLVLRHEIYNLKQVRSKYHRISTYTFSRGSSIFTHLAKNVPVTVFTAQDCKYIPNKETKLVSSFIKEVAWGLLRVKIN